MRRLVVIGALLAALAPAAASASSPTEPPDQATRETTEVGAATPPPGDSVATDEVVQPALVYDDSGNAVASIRFRGAETGWSGYPEGEEPDPGNEYVRAMIAVESLVTEGTFGIGAGDFILQNNNGFLTDAESIASANQEETDEDITDEADLANGESLDLTLTFQVVSSVGPQSIFYQPDDNDEILVDVAEVSSPDAA
jgi:hypothetical protein